MPWHFTAFHPDFRMLSTPATPAGSLQRARAIARSKGLRYVYTGNLRDREGGSTWCPSCGSLLIGRDGFKLDAYALDRDRCSHCGCLIAGRFESRPGNWGARCLPVRLDARS